MAAKFIQRDSLRRDISNVVNATFRARRLDIWSEGTTACASDSTKFGAWDQNLMTEWHIRWWRSRRNDLLACSEKISVDLFAAEALLVIRSCDDD